MNPLQSNKEEKGSTKELQIKLSVGPGKFDIKKAL
jgi:hypothetical protein